MKMRALITGAASGIGLATARHFMGNGWQVTGLDRREQPDELDGIQWIKCDLADPPSVSATCDILAQSPSFDSLIFSAGVAGVGDPAKILQINFISVRALVRMLSPHMLAGGSITLVSSGAGWRWTERKSVLLPVVREKDDGTALSMAAALCGSAPKAYNCSKELLCALVAHDCLEHWPRGVRLNSVSPGSVDTPLIPDFTNSMGPKAMQFSRATVGRDGTSKEIAEVIGFLASSGAGWINGTDIKVDGGLTGALAGEAVQFPEWADPR